MDYTQGDDAGAQHGLDSVLCQMCIAGAGTFAPIALLDGHGARVSTLAGCVFEWTPAIASASCDGTICLWDPDDGRCLLRQSSVLPAEPTQCVMLPTSRELAVCGHFQGICIIDCSTLEVLLIMIQSWFVGLRSCCDALLQVRTVAGAHHGWFTGVGLFNASSGTVLLSLTQVRPLQGVAG